MDRAVARGLAMLEVLAGAGKPMRLSRLAEDAGLQKSTVHRILQTLVILGYVEQEAETGLYGLSLKLWEMGSAVVAEHPVRRAASIFLQTLHKETGETVSLLVPSGDDVLYLERLVSPRAVRFSARPGSRIAAPLTAGGRAMLSHRADARAVLERAAERIAEKRRLDPQAMMDELSTARRRGYSVSRDTPGVVSMGCALLTRAGVPAAALSLSAPVERFDAEAEARNAEALLATCAALAESAGFRLD